MYDNEFFLISPHCHSAVGCGLHIAPWFIKTETSKSREENKYIELGRVETGMKKKWLNMTRVLRQSGLVLRINYIQN